jgi:hypothetical protein
MIRDADKTRKRLLKELEKLRGDTRRKVVAAYTMLAKVRKGVVAGRRMPTMYEDRTLVRVINAIPEDSAIIRDHCQGEYEKLFMQIAPANPAVTSRPSETEHSGRFKDKYLEGRADLQEAI